VNTKREVIVDVVVEVHQEVVVEDTLVLILMSTFSSFARV
jgi:uncharacterized protein Smg (DUF494 family)